MADQLFLSYWLRDFGERNMLRHYERMLRTFPYSRLSTHGAALEILAASSREPALFEKSYPESPDITGILADCRHFQHPDCAYLLSAEWDLWQFHEDWRLAPAPVQLVCFGPEFENQDGDHLRIRFGLETQFLPDAGLPNSFYMVKSNIQGLLHLTHELDDTFSGGQRRLWSESGENFAGRLQQALSAGS